MPSLGADMEYGTIVEWRVAPGDVVHRGDIVAVVDTEKSTIEVEVFEDGTVEELLVQPGTEVPVGTVLARLGPVESPAAPALEPARAAGRAPNRKARQPDQEPAEPAARKIAPSAPAAPSAPSASIGERRAGTDRVVRAAPRARRQAALAGVDLSGVTGSGPGGAILTTDLAGVGNGPPAAAAMAPPVRPTPKPGQPEEGRDRAAAMRHAIGALMGRAKKEIPHYYLATTVDMSESLAWLAETNATRGVERRLLPAVLLLKSTALAARRHPAMNGFWTDGRQEADHVHLGVAVSLRGGGLVAPAIHDADELSLDELMGSLKDLVGRARSGSLRSSEMSDPTITVTNLGDQGVEEVFGVIYPPQVALVGFGRIVDQPCAVGGLLGVRPVVRATLSADHRVSDGHTGALFLNTIAQLLQQPAEL